MKPSVILGLFFSLGACATTPVHDDVSSAALSPTPFAQPDPSSQASIGAPSSSSTPVVSNASGSTAALSTATPVGPSSPSAAPTPSDTASPSKSGGCADLFEPPAGAELLCSQHVMANVAEIHWRSYGVSDTRSIVNQPYRTLAGRCGGSVVFKPPAFSVSQGDRRLETYEAGSAAFPACEKGPSPTHRTVIVISEKHDRK